MAQDCLNVEAPSGSQVVAQHLFLGASVNNFSTNLGWGGSASSLTVELINDFGSQGCNITSDPFLDIFRIQQGNFDTPDHYYDCIGNACYIDEHSYPYNPDRPATTPPGPSKEKRVPGKVYHYFDANTGKYSSAYWRKHDPGFFAAGTVINNAGVYNPIRVPHPTIPNKFIIKPYRYNIIGVPVMFRFGHFTFGGVVTSWDATINGIPINSSAKDIFNSMITYRVSISSPDSILDNCKIILDEYAGSVFCRLNPNPNTYGGPTNYNGSLGNYTGSLKAGNIPNVFNVYGFLESFGFGSSGKNDNGLPLSYVLDALCVLTSSSPSTATIGGPPPLPSLAEKHAFSPFGRIIAPAPLTDALYETDFFYDNPTPANFGDNSFGILNQQPDINGIGRIMLCLDLSEVPRPPLDLRVQGNNGVMSITDLIREACNRTNRDFYTTLVVKNGVNFIKVKTIDRSVTIPINSVEKTIKNITDSGIPVTQSSFGQNDNKAIPRVMLIGANQQRLYQAKSFLLGYSNAHLIYHPVLKKFVDYYRFGKTTTSSSSPSDKKTKKWTINQDTKFVDAVRVPLVYSTRNIDICKLVNGELVTSIWANEQQLAGVTNTFDQGFSDAPVGGVLQPMTGNYNPALIYKMKLFSTAEEGARSSVAFTSTGARSTQKSSSTTTQTKTTSSAPNPRYIPLYKYVICPFFGYANDMDVPTDAGLISNRYVRPVYFDTVTGQIMVMLRGSEIPPISLGRFPPLFATRPSDITGRGTLPVPQDMKGDDPANGPAEVAGTNSAPIPPVTKKPSPTASRKAVNPFTTSLYGDINCSIKESELRAALKGFDNYLIYCMSKLDFSKPDLFVMLMKAYEAAGKSIWNAPKPKENTIDNASHLTSTGMAGAGNAGAVNAGSNTGVPGVTGGDINAQLQNVLNTDFNSVLSYEFYNDLNIVYEFIRSLAEKYYGKQYAVALPTISSYRDAQYLDLQIPGVATPLGVYQGSGKLFFSYEITDGAWEEYGNTIDDNIAVGGPLYYNFIDDKGLIQPIIGYNATPIKDYATEAWCSLNMEARDALIKKALPASLSPPALKTMKPIDNGIKDPLDWAANSTGTSLQTNYPIFKGASNNTNGAFVNGVGKKQGSTVSSFSEKSCAYIRSNYELSNIFRYFACDKSICPSLDIGALSDQDYIISYLPDAGREDAYGQRLVGTKTDPCGVTPSTVTIQTEKLYIKTTCDDKIVFLDGIGLSGPRAIINSPGVDLSLGSTSYREDPNKTIVSNVYSEDLAIIEYYEKYAPPADVYKLIGKVSEKFNFDPITAPSLPEQNEMKSYGVFDGDWATFCGNLASNDEATKGAARLKLLKYIYKKMIVPISDTKFLIPAPNTSNQSINHYMIAPKKANPVFAAIPLRDNIACYGPWTNYPNLVDKAVVFGKDINTENLIEQLISDTHIEKKDEWAPWNYGGMAFLDKAIISEIEALTSYQTRLENAEFTIAGMPIISMGGNLIIKKTDADINLYNYINIFGYDCNSLIFDIANYPGLNDFAGLALSDLRMSVSAGNISTTYQFRTYSTKRGIYNKENSDRLKLLATNRISTAKKIRNLQVDLQRKMFKKIDDMSNKRSSGGTDYDLSGFKSKLYGTSPTTMIVGKAKHYWPIGNYTKEIASKNGDDTDKSAQVLRTEKSRFDSWAGFFETREALNELAFGYNSQAGMSFDGIYSPISFYPTTQAGTYAISSRFVTSDDKLKSIQDQNKTGKLNLICPGCKNTFKIKIAGQDHACPLCQKSKILPISTGLVETSDNVPVIDFLSLNPIVMPSGDFRNPNAQPRSSGERSRHNIAFIARDENHITDRNIMINNNLTAYEDNESDRHPDWSDIDEKYKYDNNEAILNNHRFFALRGPMMVHGWGYDMDGYPVPNAADEPLEIDENGRPKRFFLKSDGTNDLSQDGAFIPTVTQPLGDIIGKGWEKNGGTWSRNPLNKFHLNWGERADLWPIGPIDLRWDYERKVWIAGGGGCNNADPPYIIASGNNTDILSKFISKSSIGSKRCSYKMIYGVLEEDLKKSESSLESFPARAFIDDLEYGLKPLPENIRRLIYIVDRTGYTAPRGAKILLRYNIETGFYEPVSKQQYMVIGKISGKSAVVELAYMPGYKSGDKTYKTTINYNNPLELDYAKTNGIFLYDNSNWNLIAVG